MFVAMAVTKADEDTTPAATYALMTLSYVGAMLASNHALQWVSYPTQVHTGTFVFLPMALYEGQLFPF